MIGGSKDDATRLLPDNCPPPGCLPIQYSRVSIRPSIPPRSTCRLRAKDHGLAGRTYKLYRAPISHSPSISFPQLQSKPNSCIQSNCLSIHQALLTDLHLFPQLFTPHPNFSPPCLPKLPKRSPQPVARPRPAVRHPLPTKRKPAKKPPHPRETRRSETRRGRRLIPHTSTKVRALDIFSMQRTQHLRYRALRRRVPFFPHVL